jgi:hypothetical protein
MTIKDTHVFKVHYDSTKQEQKTMQKPLWFANVCSIFLTIVAHVDCSQHTFKYLDLWTTDPNMATYCPTNNYLLLLD